MKNFKHALLIGCTALSVINTWDAEAGSRKFSLDDFPDLNWSGPYLGANAGYLSSFKGTGSISSSMNGDYNPEARGFTGGIYGGYNIQSSNIVYGAELDIALSSASGIKGFSSGTDRTNFRFREKNAGSLRARFGYLFGDALFYATTGISDARINYNVNSMSSGIQSISNYNHQHLGLTYGLGLDYALTPKFIARSEYRYTAYQQKSYGGLHIGADSHDWRAGLAYKF